MTHLHTLGSGQHKVFGYNYAIALELDLVISTDIPESSLAKTNQKTFELVKKFDSKLRNNDKIIIKLGISQKKSTELESSS